MKKNKLNKYPSWNKWVSNQKEPDQALIVFDFWLSKKDYFKGKSVDFKKDPLTLKGLLKFIYIEEQYKKFLRLLKKIAPFVDFSKKDEIQIKKLLSKDLLSVEELIKNLEYTFHSQGIRDALVQNKMIIHSLPKYNWFYKIKDIESLLDVFEKRKEQDVLIKVDENTYVIPVSHRNKDDIQKYAHPTWCLSTNKAEIERYYSDFEFFYLWHYDEKTKEMNYYGVNIDNELGIITAVFNKKNQEEYSQYVSDLIYGKILGKDRKIEYLFMIEKLRTDSFSKLLFALRSIMDQSVIQFYIEKAMNEQKDFSLVHYIREQSIMKPVPIPTIWKNFMMAFKETTYYKKWLKYLFEDRILNFIEFKEYELLQIWKDMETCFPQEYTEKKYVNEILNVAIEKKYKKLFDKIYNKNPKEFQKYKIIMGAFDWLPEKDKCDILKTLTFKDIQSLKWHKLSKSTIKSVLPIAISNGFMDVEAIANFSEEELSEVNQKDILKLLKKVPMVNSSSINLLTSFSDKEQIILIDSWIKNKKIDMLHLLMLEEKIKIHYNLNEKIKSLYEIDDYLSLENGLALRLSLKEYIEYIHWFEYTGSYWLMLNDILINRYFENEDIEKLLNNLNRKETKIRTLQEFKNSIPETLFNELILLIEN